MAIKIFCLTALLSALTIFTLPAWGDEITGQLEKGTQLYKEGKYSEAIEEIEFALNQVRQKKADQLATIFPDAPKGWKANNSQASSMGRSMMGGGINVSRDYKQEGTGGSAKLEVFTDSPLIQTLGMMLSNPMFLQSGKQVRLIRIKGNKALLRIKGEDRAEVQTLIANKILFQVQVRRVEDPGKVAVDFANLMDIAKLKNLSQ